MWFWAIFSAVWFNARWWLTSESLESKKKETAIFEKATSWLACELLASLPTTNQWDSVGEGCVYEKKEVCVGGGGNSDVAVIHLNEMYSLFIQICINSVSISFRFISIHIVKQFIWIDIKKAYQIKKKTYNFDYIDLYCTLLMYTNACAHP